MSILDRMIEARKEALEFHLDMHRPKLYFDDNGVKLEPGDWVDVNDDLRCMIWESPSSRERSLQGISPHTIVRTLVKVELSEE